MVPIKNHIGFPSRQFIYDSRMREKVGIKVVKALKRNHDGVKHAALDMLCALMQVLMLLSSQKLYLNDQPQ